LIELEDVTYRIPTSDREGRTLFDKLNFIVTAGMRVGLVGPNGSGKTTLLRLFRGELSASSGEIRRADWLRIVYFDQTRELDSNVTLRRALAPEGDSVIYQDRVIHVASWAARFLFTGEQLNQPVERLSGGERARVLIAQLMLQPADVLLLDEPTNDLDIPTLEILEESLLEFRGSLVLVTHDRYMLDRVSTIVLGLDGQGGAESFADYSQWEVWQAERTQTAKASAPSTPRAASTGGLQTKTRLSYLEARDYASIEERVAAAEEALQNKRAQLEDPAIASDGPRLLTAHKEMDDAQAKVDELYRRWSELEKKKS
jgi:ABC transport system ATP-binding/permease protein